MLTFIHIGDTHIHYDPNFVGNCGKHSPYKSADALIRRINLLPFAPDFVIHTGDVAYAPLAETYEVVRKMFEELKYPLYFLAGNHDDARMLQDIVLKKRETSELWFYDFEVKGYQIACLDSNITSRPPSGSIGEVQLDWLKQICNRSDDTPLIVTVHHNVLPVGNPWLDQFMGISNGDEVHQILLSAKRPIRGVFHGHIHQNINVVRDGILYSSVSSSWCQFNMWPGMLEAHVDEESNPGFNIVTVTENQVFVRHCQFDGSYP